MKFRIATVKPFVPTIVGNKSHEFRVELVADDTSYQVTVSAEVLNDYRSFQAAVLRQLGVLATYGIDLPQGEVGLLWSWQKLLEAADWAPEDDTDIHKVVPSDDDDEDEEEEDDEEELRFVE